MSIALEAPNLDRKDPVVMIAKNSSLAEQNSWSLGWRDGGPHSIVGEQQVQAVCVTAAVEANATKLFSTQVQTTGQDELEPA